MLPELAQVLAQANLGPIYDLVVDDTRPRTTFLIVYGGRKHDYLVATQSGRQTRRLSFVVCDALQYDPHKRRFNISTRFRSLMTTYQKTFGRVLFDDPKYFSDSGLWSLGLLRTQGTATLLHHGMVSELRGVIPRRILWRPDSNNRVALDGRECLDLLDKHDWKTRGELIQLELDLVPWGPRAQSIRVSLQSSNLLVVWPERYRSLAERYLRAVGLEQQHPRQLDLWSVAPGPAHLDLTYFSAAPRLHAQRVVGMFH